MMNQLVALMGNLERLHRSLLKVAQEKTSVIKSNEVLELDALLKEEQSHLAAIVQLDGAREQLVHQLYAERSGKRVDNVTISMLLDVLEGAEREQLEKSRDTLIEAVQDLKYQNDLNQQLTFQSLQFINLSLDMVRPAPPSNSMNYSKNEVHGIRPSTGAKGAFDTQA